jgi:hypothetical protein
MNMVCRHSGESTSMDESRIIGLDDLSDYGQVRLDSPLGLRPNETSVQPNLAGMTFKSNQVFLQCVSSILHLKLKSLLQ